MNAKEFNKIMVETFESCEKILGGKATNYASKSDRLSNFKSAALYQGCTPELALLGMMSKHLVAIKDYINSIPKITSMIEWEEKINDSINYLILLKALVIERRDEREGDA